MNERAFPLQSAAAHNGQYGMTLRDYFAAQALTALAQVMSTATKQALDKAADDDGYAGPIDGFIARRAYQIADAMLAERSK